MVGRKVAYGARLQFRLRSGKKITVVILDAIKMGGKGFGGVAGDISFQGV